MYSLMTPFFERTFTVLGDMTSRLVEGRHDPWGPMDNQHNYHDGFSGNQELIARNSAIHAYQIVTTLSSRKRGRPKSRALKNRHLLARGASGDDRSTPNMG